MSIITPLQESVYTLNFLHNKLVYYHKNATSISPPPDPKEEEKLAIFILDLMMAYGIVLIQSFLHECDKHLFQSIENPEHKEFIRLRCRPALKEIRKYSDLGKYRNYLSHGRSGPAKEATNIVITADHYDYDIPSNFVEYCFILNCIEAIVGVVNHVYPDYYEYVNGIRKFNIKNKRIKKARIGSDSIYEAKLEALKTEINSFPDLLN